MGLAKLAEKVGIGAKHLGRVERGEKLPSFELIIALANAMGVSPSEFFEFENAKADQKVIRERLRQLLDKRDPRSTQESVPCLKGFAQPVDSADSLSTVPLVSNGCSRRWTEQHAHILLGQV